MMASKGRRVLATLACTVLALGPALAADPACFLGSVCGNGCTSVTGSCRNGQCVGLFGAQETCQPFTNACGNAYCALNTEFCANGVCYPNTCENQKQYGCAADTSALNRVTCPDGSSFTACWASASGGFKCNENANGPAQLSCSTASGSGATAIGTSTTNSGPGVSTSATGAAPAETGVVTTTGTSSNPGTSTTGDSRSGTSASVVGGPSGISTNSNVALGTSAPPPSQGAAGTAAVSLSVLPAVAVAVLLA